MACGNEVAAHKPDPAVYLLALERLDMGAALLLGRSSPVSWCDVLGGNVKRPLRSTLLGVEAKQVEKEPDGSVRGVWHVGGFGEWYFVKRALDRRPALLLAGHGRGVDHPSAAVNIAALVEIVAQRPGRRILNAADPDAPDGLTISRVIAAVTGHTWHEVLLDEDAPPQLGRHPWHRSPPIVLDTSAAKALGYRPVGDYATTVTDEISWILDQVAQHPTWTPPGIEPQTTTRWFDYAAEDAWLRATERPPG